MNRFHWAATVCGLVVAISPLSRVHAQSVVAPAVTPARDVEQVRDELVRLKAEFESVRRQYDERLSQLEQRLSQLGGGPLVLAPSSQVAAPPPPPAPQDAAATPVPAQPDQSAGMPASSSRVFNPDTSVIGNFLGAAGKNPFSAQPSLELSEAELSLQAVVDPYARADFFLSAGPDGLNVEEGFATFTALPKQFQLKVGKMRAQFGKVNTLHTHAMPTADRPLVTTNLVGGEDGLSDSGVSLSKAQ